MRRTSLIALEPAMDEMRDVLSPAAHLSSHGVGVGA
jgi:hypothetical protein